MRKDRGPWPRGLRGWARRGHGLVKTPQAGARPVAAWAGAMAGGAGLAKRLGTLLSGLLECGAFCGIIFGWASLVFVLKDLGYFEGLCQPSTTPGPNLTLGSDCSGQDEQFSLVFTIGSFMNNFMTFPMGVVFDRFGTTAARLIAISLYAGGTLLVAFSTPELAVLLFPAMSMLSVGGILLILTNMQVGNLFGNYRSIIITLYNGAFDSSSAIFLIVKLLYEQGLSLRAMFLFLAACSAWHLLRTLFLMPRSRIPYPLPPDYNYGLQCRSRSRSYRAHKDKQTPGEAGPEETPLEPPIARGGDTPGTPFRACACSWLFAWHVAWLSVMQLRHYLFIGTLNPQLEHLAHGDHALALRGALCPLERPHPRPAQAGKGPPPRGDPGRAGRPALGGAVAGGDGGAVPAVLRARRRACPARPVRHLRAAGHQPLLPVRRQRRLPGHRVSPSALWEALRAGHGTVGAGGPAAVPLCCPGAGAAPGGPLLYELGAHHRGAGGLCQPRGGGP
ncbi:equilibrative nucleobase transporter 1 isoform X3 [Agelaius tricolor]|uniref:equilibrative nucleobase transporter 1 isoform X3 n=1 Tax=Agelaius tricolor TaxID=9191 RepID=UPI0039F1F391